MTPGIVPTPALALFLASVQGEGSLSKPPVVGGESKSAPSGQGEAAQGAAPEGAKGAGEGGPQGSGTQQPGGTRQDPRGMGPCMEPQSLVMLVAMVAIFYFLLIRPQQKQEKKRKAMLSAMKKGDKVVTNGGIHGELLEVGERTVTVKFGPDAGQRFEIERSAIARLGSDPAATQDSGKS